MSTSKFRTVSLSLALGLSITSLTGCDDESEGRPVDSAYDVDEDVDFDEDYVDGEEPPTVVNAESGWEAGRVVDEKDGLVSPCWFEILTGPLPWGAQRSILKASTYCGDMELRVGYVSPWGQESTRTREYTQGGWYTQLYTIDIDQYVNYVRACQVETGKCYGIYR